MNNRHRHLARVRATIEIGGQTIRAGEGVIASLPAANRDPATFPDPDRFDIHRKAHRHVAFAFGPRQCLGRALARLELQIAFPPAETAAGPAACGSCGKLRFKLESMACGVLALP